MLDRTCYALFMVKQSKKKKRPTDLNLLAASIVEDATNDNPTDEPSTKNPAAVALGRLGGLKGGPARAKKLTPEQRKKIARKAARSRWAKSKTS
ncbi:MAG: hypothetical protein L6406_13140 [Desulfobacterales bacterium]|nr:hypothetical protein [Desulfobacterales bacterium]